MRVLIMISCLFVPELVFAQRAATSSLPTCAWSPQQNSALADPGSLACAAGLGSVFLRENILPVCDWSDPARNYRQLLVPSQGGHGTLECLEVTRTPCRFVGGQPLAPAYMLIPFGNHDLAWDSGAALYGLTTMVCARTGTSVDRLVAGEEIAGFNMAGSGSCSGLPAQTVVLAEVDGGTVEHVHPAAVRGEVIIAFNDAAVSTRTLPVTLALQVFDGTAWVDHKAVTFNATDALDLLQPHAIDDLVDPGFDVRLQIRGTTCDDNVVESYRIPSARIQVETCIPDQSNPGSCL